MSEPRAIFLNGKWREIKKCRDCTAPTGLATLHSKKLKMVPAGNMCANLKKLGIDGAENKECMITDLRKILDNCPLPKWSDVRWHKASEKPENNNDTQLVFRAVSKWDKKMIYFHGYYNCGFRHDMSGDKIKTSKYKNFQWRHLNLGGKSE